MSHDSHTLPDHDSSGPSLHSKEARAVPLEVSRYPQHFTQGLPGIDPEYWGDRSCGVACMQSLLDYHGLPVPACAALLEEGLSLDAYNERGWIHAGLVALGTRHGLLGSARGNGDLMLLDRLTRSGRPVITSVTIRFPDDGRRGGHLVLVTGVTGSREQCESATGIGVERGERLIEGAVHIVDPSRWGAANTQVAAARFVKSWTGRMIVFDPPQGGHSLPRDTAGQVHA